MTFFLGFNLIKIFSRNESRRIYKTIIRGNHSNKFNLIRKSKQNCQHKISISKYSNLFRSPSTPSLTREWKCQSCDLANISVTWHCLNCDSVSFLAPIYKETLKKKQLEDNSIVPVTENLKPLNELNVKKEKKHNFKVRSLSMDSDENHLRKCQLCLINPSQVNNYACKHRIRLPSIQNQSKKLSFDESISYTTTNNEHIYYSNRKINKSLSSISDPIGSVTGTVFGEKITSSTNRPNSLIVTSNFEERTTIRRSFRCNTNQEIPKRSQIPISTSEYTPLRNLQQPPIYNNCTILCDVCGICNKNQCSNQEQNSRFTVTTISRSESLSNRVKNLTLPKNGGVFVAVRDWFAAATPISSGNIELNKNDSSYYEMLKNAQQSTLKLQSNVRQEPIYAVVNKANKNKNKLETKFSYVGIAEQNNGNRLENEAPPIDMKTTHITTTISGNSCNNIDSGGTSDSSSIYAEVWKGPRKSLDSQKM